MYAKNIIHKDVCFKEGLKNDDKINKQEGEETRRR